ncbi:MAG: hypothetical protein ICV84_08145 [Flavisolibacter sp.]|nr:hypothetical protein [Flavisolibacter sp.]
MRKILLSAATFICTHIFAQDTSLANHSQTDTLHIQALNEIIVSASRSSIIAIDWCSLYSSKA